MLSTYADIKTQTAVQVSSYCCLPLLYNDSGGRRVVSTYMLKCKDKHLLTFQVSSYCCLSLLYNDSGGPRVVSTYAEVQGQTSAYFSSKQLLLFAFATVAAPGGYNLL